MTFEFILFVIYSSQKKIYSLYTETTEKVLDWNKYIQMVHVILIEFYSSNTEQCVTHWSKFKHNIDK